MTLLAFLAWMQPGTRNIKQTIQKKMKNSTCPVNKTSNKIIEAKKDHEENDLRNGILWTQRNTKPMMQSALWTLWSHSDATLKKYLGVCVFTSIKHYQWHNDVTFLYRLHKFFLEHYSCCLSHTHIFYLCQFQTTIKILFFSRPLFYWLTLKSHSSKVLYESNNCKLKSASHLRVTRKSSRTKSPCVKFLPFKA